MPDLNIANPRVRDEIHKVVGYWLELGLSGFRVDAAPFLIELIGTEQAGHDDPHEYLRDLRAFLARRRGDAILLAEANLPPPEQRRFFGDEDGDEMHMVFNFVANQRLFLSLVRQQAAPLAEALGEAPPLPETGQWANFVKNHDELSLDKLTEDEREEVFAALAPDEDMRIYDRGIRRRVPPMLGGDRRRLELVYSLLFALPGTPVLLYGEEIGLGDDLAIEGRGSVRVPMGWDDEAAQRRDPGSLLNWMERLVRTRKETPELGWGSCQVVPTGDPAVLAVRCDWRGSVVLTVHNLSDRPAKAQLDLERVDPGAGLVELLADQAYDRLETATGAVSVGPYGYRWFRLGT
jgi:glycosidase